MKETYRKVFTTVRFLGDFVNAVVHDDCVPYIILPTFGKPRWIVPIHSSSVAIASLALYQPSLLRAKYLKQLATVLIRSRIPLFFLRAQVCLKKHDEEIRQLFKMQHLSYAIFLGTEGSHKKLTVQVMDEQAAILGYIKVSNKREIEGLIKNEAQTLEYLSRLSISNGLFPKVIFHGSVKNRNILVLDTLKSVYSKYQSNLSDAHINFMYEIFQKTARNAKYKESNFAKDLGERTAQLESGRLRNSYESALNFIESEIGNQEMPFGICHRDFTPWNTFFHNDKLYVFDWEYAKKEYPPLLDMYHFIIQDGILVRHLSPEGLLKRVLKYDKLLSRYSRLIGISDKLSMPLLLCYLLDISLLYIEKEKGKVEGETKYKVDIWSKMIDLVYKT